MSSHIRIWKRILFVIFILCGDYGATRSQRWMEIPRPPSTSACQSPYGRPWCRQIHDRTSPFGSSSLWPHSSHPAGTGSEKNGLDLSPQFQNAGLFACTDRRIGPSTRPRANSKVEPVLFTVLCRGTLPALSPHEGRRLRNCSEALKPDFVYSSVRQIVLIPLRSRMRGSFACPPRAVSPFPAPPDYSTSVTTAQYERYPALENTCSRGTCALLCKAIHHNVQDSIRQPTVPRPMLAELRLTTSFEIAIWNFPVFMS